MDWLIFVNYLFRTVFPFIALLLFIRQGRKQHRSVIHLIFITLFAFLGNLLWLGSLFVPMEKAVGLLTDIFMLVSNFAIFVLVEEIYEIRINFAHFAIVCASFCFYLVPNLLYIDPTLVLDPAVEEAISRLVSAGWSVYNVTIFTIAFVIYIRVYRQTSERPALILALGFGLGFVGSNIIAIQLILLRNFPSVGLETISDITSFASVILLVSTYLIYGDYVYRLPDNYYIIMVAYKNGLPIQMINLKSKKRVEITEALISGFLSAVNNMFHETLRATTDIEIMASKDATIYMQSTENVVGIVIGEKATAILRRALRRFLREFEQKYGDLVSAGCPDMSKFDGTKDLVPIIFPFFRVDDQ